VDTTATSRALIDAVASEMCEGIQRAVGIWITQIEDALEDPRLTTLGRLRAVQQIVTQYHASGQPSEHNDGCAA
jgi:hypothetical protein